MGVEGFNEGGKIEVGEVMIYFYKKRPRRFSGVFFVAKGDLGNISKVPQDESEADAKNTINPHEFGLGYTNRKVHKWFWKCEDEDTFDGCSPAKHGYDGSPIAAPGVVNTQNS